jgi:uncharacterized protein (DUF433 family)
MRKLPNNSHPGEGRGPEAVAPRIEPFREQDLLSYWDQASASTKHGEFVYSVEYKEGKTGQNMEYIDRITIEPGKRGGKPCIRGMRITVYDVLDYLASGMTTSEILADFPYLTAEDFQACLAYADDHERHPQTRHEAIDRPTSLASIGFEAG